MPDTESIRQLTEKIPRKTAGVFLRCFPGRKPPGSGWINGRRTVKRLIQAVNRDVDVVPALNGKEALKTGVKASDAGLPAGGVPSDG